MLLKENEFKIPAGGQSNSIEMNCCIRVCNKKQNNFCRTKHT